MKKIQILGTGCAKCQKLMENAQAAADSLGIAYEIVKISNIKEIMQFGVMSTPGLAIDGKVLSTGKLLSAEEIARLIGG